MTKVTVEQNLGLASHNHKNSMSCPWLPLGQPVLVPHINVNQPKETSLEWTFLGSKIDY